MFTIKSLIRLSSVLLLLAAPAFGADRIVDVGDDGCDGTCDYSSVDAAIDGEVASDSDITDEGLLIIDCYEMLDTTASTTIVGMTTDATHYILVRGVASDRTETNTYVYSTERYRMERTDAYGFYINQQNVRFENLQIKITETTGGGSYGIYISGQTDVHVYGSIFTAAGAGSGPNGIFANMNSGTPSARFYNNIFYDIDSNSNGSGIKMAAGAGSDVLVMNNTFVACRISVEMGTNVDWGNMENNVFQDCGAGSCISIGGGNSDYDYNICSDTDCNDGANGQDGVTLTFSNKAGDDFRLDATDTEAIDTGSDQSAVLTDDIEGDARSAPFDIGADETAGGGGGGSRRIIITEWMK